MERSVLVMETVTAMNVTVMKVGKGRTVAAALTQEIVQVRYCVDQLQSVSYSLGWQWLSCQHACGTSKRSRRDMSLNPGCHTAGIFQSPLNGLRLPTCFPEEHLSTQTLKRLKDELQGGSMRKKQDGTTRKHSPAPQQARLTITLPR